MFQFPGLARVSRDQNSFDSSPGLIAVFHALAPPGAETSPHLPLVAWPHGCFPQTCLLAKTAFRKLCVRYFFAYRWESIGRNDAIALFSGQITETHPEFPLLTLAGQQLSFQDGN